MSKKISVKDLTPKQRELLEKRRKQKESQVAHERKIRQEKLKVLNEKKALASKQRRFELYQIRNSDAFKRKQKKRANKVSNYTLLFMLFLLSLVIAQVLYVEITHTYRGQDLNAYAQDLYERSYLIQSERGKIYDATGNVIAFNVNEYKMYAILDPEHKALDGTPDFIVPEDIEATSDTLVKELGLTKDAKAKPYFIETLSKTDVNQVEFGAYGSSITQEQMEKIDALEIPGIAFTPVPKRFYPYGDFASYILGYAKVNENGEIQGELGLESYLDGYLRGDDGLKLENTDNNGVPIGNNEALLEPSLDGMDVYTTIDPQIQTFVQEEMISNLAKEEYEMALTIVMDAKTGAILGAHSMPSFDPNIRNIESYVNPYTDYCFEPGSTMKTFTVAAAMEAGVWDPNRTSETGKRENIAEWGYEPDGKTPLSVGDWVYNKYGYGWGAITWAQGYYFSSNTVMTHIVEAVGYEAMSKYFQDVFLFGKPVDNVSVSTDACDYSPDEPFNYANTGFGQGLTVNAFQMMQGYSAFTNDGDMVEPHVVESMVDVETDKIYYEAKNDSSLVHENVIKPETATEILKLMEGVVTYNVDAENSLYHGTGKMYGNGEVAIGGKSGTAETVKNGVYQGTDQQIYSFMGAAPIDNPEILVYSVVAKPKSSDAIIDPLSTMWTNITNSSINYLNGKSTKEVLEKDIDNRFYLESFANKNIDESEKILKDANMSVVKIGTGNIAKQYPAGGQIVSKNETIYLRGQGEFDINSLIGKDYDYVYGVCQALSYDCQIDGVGTVSEIKKNSDVSYTFIMQKPKKATTETKEDPK